MKKFYLLPLLALSLNAMQAGMVDDTNGVFCVLDNPYIFDNACNKYINNGTFQTSLSAQEWSGSHGVEVKQKFPNYSEVFCSFPYSGTDANLLHKWFYSDGGLMISNFTGFNIQIVAPQGVEISDIPESLTVGDEISYAAEVLGDVPAFEGDAFFEIKVISSNPEVLSVDSEKNTIKAAGVGKGTINVSGYVVNPKYSATYLFSEKNIDVEVIKAIEPTDISLSENSMFLSVGASSLLTATILPSNAVDNVTWTSSNNNVASVNDGLVKALASGEALITATTQNGLSASCSVTVYDEKDLKHVLINGLYYNLDLSTQTAVVTSLVQNVEILEDNSNYVSGNLEIPASVTFNGLDFSVTEIGEYAFGACERLTGVSIPSSVKKIGRYAFYYNLSLSSVSIGNSVEEIGEYAFCSTIKLSNILFPDSLLHIGDWAFYDSNISEVVFGKSLLSIGENAFYLCSHLSEVVLPDSLTHLGNGAFSECISMKNLVIGNRLTKIGDSAFSICETLKTVSFGNTLVEIGNSGFLGCSNIIELTLPESLISIGDQAFFECRKLSSVEFGNNLTSIGDSAFARCFALTSVKLPSSVAVLGQWAFEQCTSLKEIALNNTLESIGLGAFQECSRLESIEFPESITSLGAQAFMACNSLVSVIIPDNIVSLGDYVFYNCSSLQNVTIGKGVKVLPAIAFANCGSLSEVEIGENVEAIGESAFSSCSSLEAITLPEKVKTIGDFAFYGCPLIQITALPGVPPTTGKEVFSSDTYSEATLNVRQFAYNKYAAAPTWKNFLNYEAGIESLFANPEEIFSIYSISGILIQKDGSVSTLRSLEPGIYILRTNKETIKVNIQK